MKVQKLFAAVAMTAVLAACGGGGGDAPAPAPATPTPVTPTPVTPVATTPGTTPSTPSTTSTTTTTPAVITCPNGAVATTAALCAGLTANGVSNVNGTGALLVEMSGTVDPASIAAVLWQGAVGTGTQVAVTTGLSADRKTITVSAVRRLALGSSFNLRVTGRDTLGRTFESNTSFATQPMNCSASVYSTPATFSTAYGTCLAPIGVQTTMNAATNRMTDTGCTLVVGQAMSTNCREYIANGTFAFADTGIVISARPQVWVAYVAADGVNHMVLADKTTLVVSAKTGFARTIGWMIGNPTGAAIATGTGSRREQVTYNAGIGEFTFTCYAGC